MLAVLWLPVAVAVVAGGLRLGSVHLVRTQLQVAADAAALHAAASLDRGFDAIARSAREDVSLHRVAGRPVQWAAGDVELGVWDLRLRRFTPSHDRGNAVRVTVRNTSRNEPRRQRGRLLRWSTPAVATSAVAWSVPRDIALVVDLSGPMNDGTWDACGGRTGAVAAVEGESPGCSPALRQLYDDFGFGSCPGPEEDLGQVWGVTPSRHVFRELTADAGPLARPSVAARYRIEPSDSAPVRKRKACRAVIDRQIARLMPEAIPAPDSRAHYAYWERYLDYLVRPAGDTPPDASPPRVGYRTYMQFMLDQGRDRQPVPGRYVPLSCHSGDCPWHAESTAAGTFSFPPRTQPMHSVRLALIAAIQRLSERNAAAADPAQADWVAVITYDSLAGGGPLVAQPLDANYAAAARACARLQAAGRQGADGAVEAALIEAWHHLQPRAAGGRGRPLAEKIVVLITASAPHAYRSDRCEIQRGMDECPRVAFDPRGRPADDAALVQAAKLRRHGWQLHVVGVGDRVDREFLGRLALAAGVPEAGQCDVCDQRGPDSLTRHLLDLLNEIVDAHHPRIVQ